MVQEEVKDPEAHWLVETKLWELIKDFPQNDGVEVYIEAVVYKDLSIRARGFRVLKDKVKSR